MDSAAKKPRSDRLDLWRSLAVVTMVVFHALWDLEQFGYIPAGMMQSPAADIVRFLGGGSFILISGILVLSSRRALRRGFHIFCIGLAVAVATALIGMPVRFGILQLIGASMMLCAALRTQILRFSGSALAALFLLCFILSWWLTSHVRVAFPFLYPLGLRTEGFYSADYWPLLPWSFLYLLGTQMGLRRPRPDAPERRAIPAALTFPGRHSLVIYLLHQPLLYGLCYLLFSEKS